MEETSFEELPQDLLMEIMSRLPLKSLVRCICVSKKCVSLIRSNEFRNHYLRRSMTRPRLLFVNFPFGREVVLHSVYQEKEPLLSSGQQQIRISPDPRCEISQPIRGLLCIQENTKIVILNPGTKKLLTKLPEIQARKNAVITSFFGYDESTDVFKVLLCMTRVASDGPSEGAKEHQILTVSFGEESCWRRITCNHDHSPVTQGLFKGGFLYYGAQSNISDKSLVMSFNVASEDFTVIELPEDIVQLDHRWKLVNYSGDIALVNDSDFDYGIVNVWNGNGDGVFELWVRNETAGTWRRNKIEIPYWEETVDNNKFYFKGTIGTGELVFTLDSVIERDHSLWSTMINPHKISEDLPLKEYLEISLMMFEPSWIMLIVLCEE